MDNELGRRKPVKRPHRKVVGAAVVKSELFLKIKQRKEGVAGVETFLIFSVAAFDFAVVARSIRTDELVADTELRGGVFKEGGQVPLGVGETVGELKAVVGLYTLHGNPARLNQTVIFRRKSAEE